MMPDGSLSGTAIGPLQEAKQQLLLAAPVSVTFLLNKSVNLVSVLVVGHLGPAELAAASLASSLANVLGNSLIAGLASGLSTLCGQAYGAGNWPAVGIWAQRAWIICMLVCIPICAVWLAAEPLLLLAGQTPAVSHMTAAYLRLLIPGLITNTATTCMSYYLQAQGIVRPGAYSSFVVAVLHVPIIFFLVYTCGLGYLGAGLAVSVSYMLQMCTLFAIILRMKLHEKTWPGWSKSCLEQWRPFLKLGLPSLLMISEWWASEVVVMCAGLLQDAQRQLSAMAIYQNTNALCFMVPVGLSIACATRVANELGAQQPKQARSAALTAVTLTAFCTSILGLLLLGFRGPWSRLFSDDSRLNELVQVTLVPLAVYVIVDGLQCTISGMIRGSGQQAKAVWIVLPSYWVVGVPVALLLGFKTRLGVQGLCLGMLMGTAVHTAAFTWLWRRTDWQEEAAKAADRTEVKMQLAQVVTSGGHEQTTPGAGEDEDAMLLAHDGWQEEHKSVPVHAGPARDSAEMD